ncbi:MAG: flagellar protein FlaG [Betaproteobacteria bacterium]
MLLSALQRVVPGGNASADAGAGVAPKTAQPQISAPPKGTPVDAKSESAATSRAALQVAVESVQDKVKLTSSNLKFSIDEDSGKTIVRVVDDNTNEVIRQIPSEEMLAIARNLARVEGALLDKKV